METISMKVSIPEEEKKQPEDEEEEECEPPCFQSSSLRTETFTYISIVYAQILISICITYLVAEVITHNIPIFYFEEFFTYLYTVSILFLIYVLIYLKRETPRSLGCGVVLPKLNVSCPWSSCATKDPDGRRKKHKISDNEKSHGSIFIRFGVVIFGLGTVTHAALEFGSLVEVTVSSPCHDFMYGFNSFLQVIFTFLQMYFLFTNARINIQKFKHIARFGLMHLAATNLCVWFKILVRESIHDIHEYENEYHKELNHAKSENDTELSGSMSSGHTHAVTLQDVLNCSGETILGNIVSVASPYIFPLVIEYSLIAATVVYLMWKHVGVNPVYLEDKNPPTKTRHSKLDFNHSSKGLFGGLFIFLGIIISLILFFVLSDNEDKHYVRLAVYFVDASHCLVLIFCIVISIIGLHQTQRLKYHDEPEDELTELLLRISAFGWYLYSLFTIIACAVTKSIGRQEDEHEAHEDDHNHVLNEKDMPVSEVTIVLIGAVINMIQVTVQLFFMNDVSKKSIHGKEMQKKEPGRQAVTFLFMCNFSLWLLYTFEAAKVEANPVQQHFYGPISWAILLRITLPMGIFFRFHSSVTMAEIWKNTYKQRLTG